MGSSGDDQSGRYFINVSFHAFSGQNINFFFNHYISSFFFNYFLLYSGWKTCLTRVPNDLLDV